MSNLFENKNWSKDIETETYSEWKNSERYKFDKHTKKKVYSIDTPPPYVNAPVHIGHATTYTLMDMFARYKRMTGHEVLFPLGLDRNGLPIEMAAEKKFNIKFNSVSRAEFMKYCHKVLEEASMASVESFLRLGISFNSWNKGKDIGEVYETDSDDYRELTQETFIDLWHKGLIYEDDRYNNWCPGCQTTIADAEIDYAELPSFFNDIKFKVKETGEDIIIGTTRPELICTCEMICYNPEDERYRHLEGKNAVTPIFEKVVPIKADPVAQMDKGTGLMMMCSFGDVTDIRFFRDNGLKATIAINKDGTLNDNAGQFKGMPAREAQKAIIMELDKRGLLFKQTKIKHRTPICARSNHPVEFINMKEFYLKQVEFKDKIMEMAKSPSLRFYAPESRQILIDWINSVSIDWPISRRRYYATEIPLWYCQDCKYIYVPPKGKYYRPWTESCPIKECPQCGSTGFIGEERVFDTWFDSSISPLYILKYGENNRKEFGDFFNKSIPCTLRPQGREIIRTWLYYTLLKDYLLTGKCIFSDVWINYYVLDERGYKMSKSQGNGIDPKDILDKYGAEPFRLWTALEGNIERSDFRCSFERIEGAGKTVSKFWNVSKFINMFPKLAVENTADAEKHLTELDKWVLNETNLLIIKCHKHYEMYDFHTPVVDIRHFIWETFASHYIELVKNRAYNHNKEFTLGQQHAAIYTLHKVMEALLNMLAPVIPLMTYRIYMEMYGKDIHFQPLVNPWKIYEDTTLGKDDITELNSFIWKSKKENGKSLKEEIKKLVIDEKFRNIQHDIMSAHNVKHLDFSEKDRSVEF